MCAGCILLHPPSSASPTRPTCLIKSIRLLTVLALSVALAVLAAQAQETPAEAKITAVSGYVSIAGADGSSVRAVIGQKVAVGATITTGPNGQLSLQVHEGIVAVFTGSSSAVVEKLSTSENGTRNTVLRLTKGSVATSLDPSRKHVNNYGVRTDKGLAVAHGTTMTVTVNDEHYTVSVLVGVVTVNWSDGRSVSIAGSTPADITSWVDGQVQSGSIADALTSNSSPGLAGALTAAASAVAAVATNTGQITAVIQAIASAAGTGPDAANLVAGVTAAATGTAIVNGGLVAATGSTTLVAAEITSGAVGAATAAGNGSAATLIVISAVNAVTTTLPNTNINLVTQALTQASNSTPGNTQVDAGQVTAGIGTAVNPITQVTIQANTTVKTPFDTSVISPSG